MPEQRITSGYVIRGLPTATSVAVVLSSVRPADEHAALSEQEGVAEVVLYEINGVYKHAARRAVDILSVIEISIAAARAPPNSLERFGGAEATPDRLARFFAAYLRSPVPHELGEGATTAYQRDGTFFLCLPADPPDTLQAKRALLMALCLHCTGASQRIALDTTGGGPQAPADRRWAVHYAPLHRAADLPDHVLLHNLMLARVEEQNP
jgi:hypothetical protein